MVYGVNQNKIIHDPRTSMSSESIRNYVDNGHTSDAKVSSKQEKQGDVFESANKKKKIKTGIFATLAVGAVAFLGAMGLARKGVLKRFPKSFGEVFEKIKDMPGNFVKSLCENAQKQREKQSDEGIFSILKDEFHREVDHMRASKREKWEIKKKNKALRSMENSLSKRKFKAHKKQVKRQIKAEKRLFESLTDLDDFIE